MPCTQTPLQELRALLSRENRRNALTNMPHGSCAGDPGASGPATFRSAAAPLPPGTPAGGAHLAAVLPVSPRCLPGAGWGWAISVLTAIRLGLPGGHAPARRARGMATRPTARRSMAHASCPRRWGRRWARGWKAWHPRRRPCRRGRSLSRPGVVGRGRGACGSLLAEGPCRPAPCDYLARPAASRGVYGPLALL